MNELFDKVKTILVENLHVDESEITPKAELINDLGISSLELSDLICLCEEEFDITIDDYDIHKFITVEDVVNYLAEVTEGK